MMLQLVKSPLDKMADKFYITTAIPYVNARPHIGFALEAIQTDVIARYMRICGRDVWFLSGTDEHGAKVSRAAKAANKSINEFVDENSSHFKKLLEVLNISSDDFIRTSDQARHFPGAVELWKRIAKSGDLAKSIYRGLYCVGCEAFITEKDLVRGKCPDHDAIPESLEEENYFFKLSKYADRVKKIIESGELNIIPEKRKNETLALIESGLEDVSFSRPAKDISWGVPVPGDPTQTMYVWSDALVNYISALGFGGSDEDKFKKFWPADAHVIGKDIFRFHTIIWPGMLMSAGLPLPKTIYVHGFIVVGGKKMSKSLGNVVDPFDVAERYGSEALRYYLLREIPAGEDGDFTEEKMLAAYNANLANGLGNYVARISKMIADYFAGILVRPDVARLSAVPLTISPEFFRERYGKDIETFGVNFFIQTQIRPQYAKAMDRFQFSGAMDQIWRLLGALDGYIQTYEPFKLVKLDKEKTEAVLWQTAYGALEVAWLVRPFMPETSNKIFKIFSVEPGDPKEVDQIKIFPHAPLFPRK